MTEQAQLRVFVFHATEDQVVASWVRQQELNRDAGEPYYERLVDPVTGRVVASCAR
jgi:hypothetical protein